MVKDFEKERAEWEQNSAKLKVEMSKLENQITQMKKEKTNLESQLSVQSQVTITFLVHRSSCCIILHFSHK